MKTHFKNGNILIDNQFKAGASFTIRENDIVDVANETPEGEQYHSVIDLKGNYVVPGLIDLQLYGTEGFFFGGEPTVENLQGMEEHLLAHGVTGFLATIATNTDSIVLEAIAAAKAFRPQCKGAFMGLHLEGPFLNAKRKGAHPEHLIRKAVLEEVKNWIAWGGGEIKMITIAPELQDEAVLTFLYETGVVISAGHSNATFEQASEFLNKTVKTVTHLFNAMPPLHHRDPGLVAAIFEQKPYASIIADGIHVSYPMMKLAKRELGDRLFLITDAVASSNSGVYQHQRKQGYYATPEGILSGSSLELLDAVKNCVAHVGITAGEAFAMAATYPARAIGLEDVRGRLAAGNSADFLVLDRDFKILQVWFNGEVI